MYNYVKPKFGDPSPGYRSMERLWSRARAVLDGENAAKTHDEVLDLVNYTNLLIPFSPNMSQAQYNFFRAEAELPGLVGQYARVLADGLLRKAPSVELPEGMDESIKEWLENRFTDKGDSLYSFMADVLWEEIATSAGWISVDYPNVDINQLTSEERELVKPYPVRWSAEQVTNFVQGRHPRTGAPCLLRVQFRYVSGVMDPETGHEEPTHVLEDHYLDDGGWYTIDVYHRPNSHDTVYENGEAKIPRRGEASGWQKQVELTSQPLMQGRKLSFIPAYPVSGSYEYAEPMLQPLVNREIALYNKVSRRNHLMYGASTYTPYIKSNMDEDEFMKIVSTGLGSWLKINEEDDIGVLQPPTAALSDMEKAIAGTVDEMTRMGIRMLSPETAQSGVALEIRNASQTARLGMLNQLVSNTMRKVISVMIRWEYGLSEKELDTLEFQLSTDFNPTPLGADWMRLVTEWYQARLVPRSAFLHFAKQNDLLPNDYDDEAGAEEIQTDELVPGYEGLSAQNPNNYEEVAE